MSAPSGTQVAISAGASDVADASRAVGRAARLSLVCGVAVLGLKLAAWRLTGSVALFSDALESVVNVVAAAAMLVAVRVARRPPDENHPFGHGKAEYLSAVLESGLIAVAALGTLRAAIPAVLSPAPLRSIGAGGLVAVVATAVNAALSWYLTRLGRRHRSIALEADGAHVRADVVTSVGVLVGVVLARVTGWWRLDPLVAVAVAVHILWVGAGLLRRSIGGLMDELLAPEETERLLRVARDVAREGGGLDVQRLRLRHVGPFSFCDLELVVPGSMTVETAHSLGERVEGAVRSQMPATEVVVHVEPAARPAQQGDPTRGPE